MKYTDAEKEAIIERIRECCSTSVSLGAEAKGRKDDYVTVMAYPFQEGCPCAHFSWETAKRIALKGGKFVL